MANISAGKTKAQVDSRREMYRKTGKLRKQTSTFLISNTGATHCTKSHIQRELRLHESFQM